MAVAACHDLALNCSSGVSLSVRCIDLLSESSGEFDTWFNSKFDGPSQSPSVITIVLIYRCMGNTAVKLYYPQISQSEDDPALMSQMTVPIN